MANRHKRTNVQRAADLLWLEQTYLRGTKNPTVLVKQLNAMRPYRLTHHQIAYDLCDLKKRWLATVAEDVATARAAQLSALDDQEQELWVAWQRSKEDAVTESQKVKKRSGAGGAAGQGIDTNEAEKASRKVAQTGDPAFQRLILDVRARRAKLLGIDAPEQQTVHISGPDGGKIELEVKTKEPFDIAEYHKLSESFLGSLAGNGVGEPVHPAHADAQASDLPGAHRP